MRKKIIFVIVLFSLFCGLVPLSGIPNEGYGENEESLGQFVDTFQDLNNISVRVSVERNATLDAMELNYTEMVGNWLTDWSYRKPHIMVGSVDGPKTNYQVGVKVYYGAGVDGTETVNGFQYGKVYMDSKCETGFGDIRFTDADGDTLLNYWIESQVNSSYAIIWVMIPSFPVSPNTISFFIYYGNSIETTSDGPNTFPDLFDHFDGPSLNLTIWNVDASDGSVGFTNSIIRVQGNAGANRYSFSSKVPFRVDYNHSVRYLALIEESTGSYQITQLGWGNWGILLYAQTKSYHGQEQGTYRDSGGGTEIDVVSDIYFGDYFIYEITRDGLEGEIFVDGTSISTGDLNPDADDIGVQFYVRDSERDIYCDWVFIREWTPNEPTHDSWGLEATGTGGYSSGYFTTVNYLSDNSANGSALVQMTNTSMPENTAITVEFSDDNSSWTLNDWQPIFGGFESIDLRDLNYSSAFYIRYNLSTSDAGVTPRIYQSRLITTIGYAEIIVQNITEQHINGTWEYYNLTSITTLVGVHDNGDVNSTLDIDGDIFNCSETVGTPAYLISFNWTNVNQSAHCLWVTGYIYYDGNLAHHIHVELYNFSSSSWIELGLIDDDIDFEWHNFTVYELRNPDDFISSDGDVWGRFNHVTAGNINHDIHIEFLKLHVFIPTGLAVAEAGGLKIYPLFLYIIISVIVVVGASMWKK